MTKQNAERIMEAEVVQLDPAPHAKYRYQALSPRGDVWAESEGHKQSQVLSNLVSRNYARVSVMVKDWQTNLCARCGEKKPLSVHHKVFRSHGRKDTAENLEALCSNCHNAAHGLRTS